MSPAYTLLCTLNHPRLLIIPNARKVLWKWRLCCIVHGQHRGNLENIFNPGLVTWICKYTANQGEGLWICHTMAVSASVHGCLPIDSIFSWFEILSTLCSWCFKANTAFISSYDGCKEMKHMQHTVKPFPVSPEGTTQEVLFLPWIFDMVHQWVQLQMEFYLREHFKW